MIILDDKHNIHVKEIYMKECKNSDILYNKCLFSGEKIQKIRRSGYNMIETAERFGHSFEEKIKILKSIKDDCINEGA